jgi:hypothetical protein
MRTTSTKALLASCEMSYLIAKNKMPHTIGDTLLLPAAIKRAELCMLKNMTNLLRQFFSLIIQ